MSHAETGIQNTEDVCIAINTAVNNMQNSSDSITYFAINFDIDGPLADSEYMAPLKQDKPTDPQLIINQMKSFKHYIYNRSKQIDGIISEREIIADNPTRITLPSLRNHKLSYSAENRGKVLIESRHLLSDNECDSIFRYHRSKVKPAPNPKIKPDPPIIEPKIKEIERQINARKELRELHNINNVGPMDDIDVDSDIDDAKFSDNEMMDNDGDMLDDDVNEDGDDVMTELQQQ